MLCLPAGIIPGCKLGTSGCLRETVGNEEQSCFLALWGEGKGGTPSVESFLFGVFGEFLCSAGSARQVPDLGAVIYNNI